MSDHTNIDGQKPEIKRSEFGKFKGDSIEKITISYKGKLRFSMINFGAIITEIQTPDKNGFLENIVLSYDNPQQYIDDTYYIGAIVGRYANRIRGGSFRLNGKKIQLSQNAGQHHLHGGFDGFNKILWNIDSVIEKLSHVEIHMSHFSKSGSEGYPGNLSVDAFFRVFPEKLEIEIIGNSGEDSVFNPTQHSYFNLSGKENSDINSHLLKIDSKQFVEVNSEGIPSGKLINVSDTDFNFLEPRSIKSEYDHCWVLMPEEDQVGLVHKDSGRTMILSTNSPGLQVYTANDFKIDNDFFRKHHSICLEPQHFPDSPNHSIFPSSRIEANTTKRFFCTYKFGLI